jgi:hypothetical protein
LIVTGTYTCYHPPCQMSCVGNIWTRVVNVAGTTFANPAARGTDNFLPQETQ